jgi:transcriptional regulator with XRE-family HTH domain
MSIEFELAPYTDLVKKGAHETPKVVETPNDKAFGLRLQEIRKRRGMSQVEVAGRLGIHPSLISQYERGYLRLHGALLVRLAHVLKTTPDEILAARQPSDGDAHPLDRRFVRRLQKIDRLSAHDKRLLLGTIDKFLRAVS